MATTRRRKVHPKSAATAVSLGKYHWDVSWTVFAPFTEDDGIPAARDLRRIPARLRLGKKSVEPIQVPAASTLDLAPWLDEPRLHQVAVVYIPLRVEEAGYVVLGVGADWWYQAWIDGQPVSDTLLEGNDKLPVSPHDHVVLTALEAGDHLLVIRFISGSGSSVLCLAEAGDILLATLRARQQQEALERARSRASIAVDFDQPCGTLKALNGVNNGPIYFDQALDVSNYYRELGFPTARLHDSNWPARQEVDIPTIFPDFNADPDDPASYDFRRTDDYLAGILATGAQIIYRLGVSIEHTRRHYNIDPPRDFAHWARICAGVVRHYNQGWADGFHYNITHWEIWNEPSNRNMWSGTMEQYCDLYATAARTLKALDRQLKIGGPIYVYLPESAIFLSYCRRHRVPLDFYVWHWYGHSLNEFSETARAYRNQLQEYGYGEVEIQVTEWNYLAPEDPLQPVLGAQGSSEGRREWRRRVSGEVGASFAAAVLTMMQDEPVDGMNYYDGTPSNAYCGLFDFMGVPQKPFYAFKAFQLLRQYPTRVQAVTVHDTELEYHNLSALAAVDNASGDAAILVSQYDGRSRSVTVELHGSLLRDGAVYEVLMLDKYRDLQLMMSGSLLPGEHSITVPMLDHAVALVRLRTRGAAR